jgi:AbiU2
LRVDGRKSGQGFVSRTGTGFRPALRFLLAHTVRWGLQAAVGRRGPFLPPAAHGLARIDFPGHCRVFFPCPNVTYAILLREGESMAESEQSDERSSKLERLKNDLMTDLWYSAQQYKQLYVDDQTVKFLNYIAPDFFGFLQRLCWFNIVLAITRFLDRDTRTLSFVNFHEEYSAELNCKQWREISALLAELKQKAKPFRDFRNNYLAHRNWQTVQTAREIPLRFQDVREVWDMIVRCFGFYDARHAPPQVISDLTQGAGTLLNYLKDSTLLDEEGQGLAKLLRLPDGF